MIKKIQFKMGIITNSKPARQILVLGFDGAGKTTILYQLNSKDIIHSRTIGFSTEMTIFQNHTFFSWDIPQFSQKIFDLMIRYYCENAEGKKKQ